MRFVLAALLAVHGVAHVVGFVSSWRLATLAELPYKTTIFAGRVDVGDSGIRAFGVLWLLAAVAFIAAGITVAMAADWTGPFGLTVVIFSLMLCLTAWPDARLGAVVNVALIILLVMSERLNAPILVP